MINYTESFNFKPIPSITPASDYWQNGTWKFNMPEITVGTAPQPSWQDIILSGNTALTLTNALANGLNYVKLFGGTEQRNLPTGYTQVEFLQSSGTQYIDTGIVPKTTLSAKIKYNVLQLTSQNNIAIFGSISSQVGMFAGVASEQPQYYINSGAASLPDIPFAINTIREEEYINNAMIRSGVTYTTNPINENNISMILFGRNTGTEATRIGGLRIYYFTLYDNGILIQNLIPARRNSDSVLGMYDTVTDTFLTNAGTGTFTAGADVTTPTPTNPIDIVCNNGVIKVSPNLFNNSTLYNWFFTSGVITYKNDRYAKYMRISSSETYIISRNDNYNVPLRIVQTEITPDDGVSYNIDGTTTFVSIESNQFPFTFTSRGSAKFLVLSTDSSLTEAQSIDLFNKLQVELGSTATTYMPYGQIYVDGTQEVVTDSLGNTANAERLLAVGNYKDTQEVLSGDVSRSVGIKVFDGTENWVYDSQYSRFSLDENIGVVNTTIPRSIPAFCTHYRIDSSQTPIGNLPDNTGYIGSVSGGVQYSKFWVHTSAYNDATNYKAFLASEYQAGHPVVLVYPLATATTETVTPQPMNIQEGTNIVQITQASMDDLELEVKYKAGVSVTITEIENAQLDDNVEVTIQ